MKIIKKMRIKEQKYIKDMGRDKGEEEAHVVLIPFVGQGHIKPLLCMAELLSHAGVAVTFLNSLQHHRLLSATMEALTSRFPSLRFQPISDDHEEDNPRNSDTNNDDNGISYVTSLFKFLPQRLRHIRNTRPVTAIIADDITTIITIDHAVELGIPIIVFQVCSAISMWAQFWVPKLHEDGQIPFKDDEDMDKMIKGIPEMEGMLRFRDLPGPWKTQQDIFYKNHMIKAQKTKASGLIVNTIQDIEDPFPSQLATFIPNTFAIGPLHLLSKTLLAPSDQDDNSSLNKGSSLRHEEDRTCMEWLDSQPSQSVLYVSFGSVEYMTKEQLMEFWHGLNNSGKPFLWVVRSDILKPSKQGNSNEFPKELEYVGAGGNGYIARWVNQEEVLAHRAVGGFLTHAGWNSVMEAIVAAVPMICSPVSGDQLINSRWISEVWKIGFDMKDKCDRATVEKMVRDLMEDKRDEVMRSMSEVSKIARGSIKETGCSFKNLQKLVDHIKSLV